MSKSQEIEPSPQGAASGGTVTQPRRTRRRAEQASQELILASELDQALGFRLRRAASIADASFGEVFAPLGITTQHYAILMSVRRNPGCSPSLLGELLNITPNNIVPHIDGLVERGYVRRVASRTDRRVKHLRLTPAGTEFTRLIASKHEEVRARLDARMGAENVARLLEMLSLYEA